MGRGPGEVNAPAVVSGKITFLLSVRSIRVGFRLSDKIMQRFGAVRAKPVTAETSLIHPD